jgi:hypothetical protein
LTGGTNKPIAKYKFVFDNGSNRTPSPANKELKAQMQTLVLNIATSSDVAVTNVRAYLESASSYKTDAVSGQTGTATLDLTSMAGETEYVDGTVTLVITANIDVTGTGKYLQTSIANLGASGDFTYSGNHGTGTAYDNAKLDITDVSGATLSN